MKRKITKRFVDNLYPTDKPQFVFDTEIAGFVLKVTPAGRKVYQFRYRMGGRSTPLKTYTIGKHGPLAPEQARRQAQILLGDVRSGIDPAAEKRRRRVEDRGARTLEDLSQEFLEIYGRTQLKRGTLAEYERAFRSHINPRMGTQKVRDVSHSDVERLHHAMRATPTTANRTVAALSKFFSWAIRGGYRPDHVNPSQGLRMFKEHPRKRYLSAPEIAALGNALRDCEADGRLDIWQAAFIRALLLTGLRRDELRGLEWRHVDLERSVLIFEDTKTGPRELPISGPLRELLRDLPRVEANPFVFPGKVTGQPIVNIAKPWKRVLAEAGIDPTRIHDLRHTAASIAVTAGFGLPLVGAVLGHKSSKTTERYAHCADDPVRETSEAIAQHMSRAMEGNAPPDLAFHRQWKSK